MNIRNISKRMICAGLGALVGFALLLAWLIIGGRAIAGPYDLLLNQRNANDDGNNQRVVAHPSGWGTLGFDGAGSLLPVFLEFGSGLNVAGGVLSASSTPRSFSYTTRTLNSCFQVSSTRDAFATYSVDILTSLSLTTGQQGTVFLEIFTDSGCTTGTQEITRFVNGQTGTLTIGLALSQNVTGTLSGIIPAGSFVRLRTQNNTGTPTFTARPGQEVLL